MAVPLRSSAHHGARRSSYREWGPTVGAAAVRCTWEGEPGWSRSLRVLPDGCVDVTWNGEQLTVTCGVGAPVVVPVSAGRPAVGVRLRAGAAGGVLGPGFGAAGPVVALAELMSVGTRTVDDLAAARTPAAQRALLERLVRERVRAGFGPDPVVAVAVRALAVPGARVETVAERLGVGTRTLRRRVLAGAGCGPKELQRVLRFRRFVGRLPALAAGSVTLAGASAALGFADQAHLGRECRRLSGVTPGALLASWVHHTGVAESVQTPAR